MSFYQELPYPVIVGTGSILTSGGTETLTAGQVALVNADTYQAIPVGATVVANPRVLIASGSYHTVDSLSKFIGGLQQSIKTQAFKAKDVIAFDRSRPTLLSQDVIQLGWDGVNACDSLAFNCGTSYFFKVNVSGEDVFRTYSRPLYRFIELKTDCCPSDNNDCATGCNNATDPSYYAQKLATLINTDVELKYFVKAEAVISNYTATTPNYTNYQIQICDNGDVVALTAVQTAYQNNQITRVARVNSVSTYQLQLLTSAGAPANFTPTGSILLAVCGTCPSGYTSVASFDYYIVRRAIAGTENFAAGTTTFTNTVNTDYSVTGSTFLGSDASVALVQIKIATGTTVTALKDDVVIFSHTTDAKCTPPANSSIAWVAVQTLYKGTRTQAITLAKPCGTGNQLTAIEAFYASDTSIVSGSISVSQSGTCADTYQLSQYSDIAVIDDCLSPAPVTYSDVQSYNGFYWKTAACEPSNLAPAAPSSPVYAGVRLTGAYADTRFGNCSFEPTDYFSTRPLRIQIEQVDSTGQPCDGPTKVTRLQFGTVATQTGEYLIRQYLKAASLEAYNAWSTDPRIREVLDQHVLRFIDRTKLYNLYYVIYLEDRFNANWNISQPNDKFETIIAFPTDVDTTNFETLFNGFFSQVGVYLKDRK